MKTNLNSLIFQLKETKSGKPWIGSSFDKKLSTLNNEEFFRRPLQNLHSVAELISHLTIWRKETVLKIKTGEGSITDKDPLNWQDLENLKIVGRKKLMEDFDQSLDDIIELLQDKNDDFLDQCYYDTDFKDTYPYSFVLLGMLHHDLYHLGQIGIIVKFLNDSK